MNPPVEVYEAIAKLNRDGLLEAADKLDFRRMYQCFDRMAHALEQVEQYRMEQARKELRERGQND